MAKIKITFPTELEHRLSALSQKYDGVVQKMLVEGVEPLETAVKSRLRASIGSNLATPSRSTGDLLKSIKVTKAYQTANGDWNIRVAIYGYDRKGVANALKGMVLEHGSSSAPFAARPWLKPAAAASKKQCLAKMQSVFEREASKL